MQSIDEVSPPGWGHTKAEKEKTKPDKPKSKIGGSAAAFKRALDDGRFKGLPGSTTKKEKTADMFKLMWAMKNKGDKPHYKPGTDKKYKKYQEEETSPMPNVSFKDRGAIKKRAKNLFKRDLKGDHLSVNEEIISEKDLNAAERRALPNKDFALPGKGEGPQGKQAGSYPIPDEKHARSALSLVSQHGTSKEKAMVRAKVKKKFPNINVSEGKCDDCDCKGCGQNPCVKCGEDHHKLGKKVDEGVVARVVRDTIDKLPQGRPGGKRERIRQAAVKAEIGDKKSKEKGTTYRQWADAVNAAKKRQNKRKGK